MVITRLDPILLNHRIKILWLHHDLPVSMPLQDGKDFLACTAVQTLTAAISAVGNNQQVLDAVFADETNPPLDCLQPALRKTVNIDRQINGIFAERSVNFIQGNHDGPLCAAETQIIVADKRGNSNRVRAIVSLDALQSADHAMREASISGSNIENADASP